MSSTTRKFEPNDLIWAKMKGFPPWPAKVLSTEPSGDIPSGRISVMFFGTKETAFMKATDLFSYMDNRHQFEVPRKHKGFNEGINEIRQAAGLAVDELFNGDADGQSAALPPPSTVRTHRSSNNSKLLADVFLSSADRNRTKSINSFTRARSRTSSSASLMKSLMQNMKKQRNRLNSESSTGSNKRRLLMSDPEEQRLVLDAFDHLNPLEGYDPAVGLIDQDDDTRSKRSRGSSRVFEEYMLSANRMRTRSGSEGGRRSRLISGISGVSDVFDELYDQAHNIFSHEALMLALDNLPSEGSSGAGGERARTPEAPVAPLAGLVKFCTDCGCECLPHGNKWRCTSKFCLKFNGVLDVEQQPSTSRSSHNHHEHAPRKVAKINPNPPPVPNPPTSNRVDAKKRYEYEERKSPPPVQQLQDKRLDEIRRSRRDFDDPSDSSDSSPGRIKRKAIRISPPPPPVRSPTRRAGAGRPQKYKVEKTPPVSENGLRNCAFCGGQVRPQMCGGSKHRWRCVDKKCRKWYGWVKTSDEIPKDINKKALGASPDKSSGPGSVEASPMPAKRLGRPPKAHGLKIRLGTTKKEMEAARPKRKYTKRKDREAAAAAAAEQGLIPVKLGKRALSPLTEREALFKPSALQRRGRWWISEKRRNDYSPPREIKGDLMDSAASFRLISQAMRACSVSTSTSAGEPDSVSGALDIMMDSLMAAMAPLANMLNSMPMMAPLKEANGTIWKASTVHTPIFQ